MQIRKYIKEKKKLYNTLMSFLENPNFDENEYSKIIIFANNQDFEEEEKEKIQQFCRLITKIADNHHRDELFFRKIFKIINNYQEQIKQAFSNFEIFDLFQSNKLILLYLLENKIIVLDEEIYEEITDKKDYCYFFYPEIKETFGERKKRKVSSIENQLLSIDPNIIENFDEKRHKGVNDSYICSLIREDSLDEFIEYVARTNIQLTSIVKYSIFETNPLLIEHEFTSLIEYSAFYGSIQIFQYLRLNGVELNASLRTFIIHSENAELFHLIESLKPRMVNLVYWTAYMECIKCHHNDFADYIKDNLIDQDDLFSVPRGELGEEIFGIILGFHNYAHFPDDFKEEKGFLLHSYGYNKLGHLLNEKKKKMNCETDSLSSD